MPCSVRSAKKIALYGSSVLPRLRLTPALVLRSSPPVGGADAHRHDLSAMVMLKDNHIWSKGSITKAVESAKAVAGFALKIEVECNSVEQALEALGTFGSV